MAAPLSYRAWVFTSGLILPFAALSHTRRLRDAGVSVTRAHETLGHATEERPGCSALIWFHAASVGESLSVLALITRIGLALPQARFLITTGTATSARLVAQRLPPRSLHQFAPLDARGPITRFLKHWHPDAAVFVESELWPQMLRRTHASGTRMALVNARLSDRSIARWRRAPNLSAYILGVFDLILTQNDAMAEAMVAIHAPADRVARGINLKSMAGPLPIDEDTLFEARAALGHRPVWVAASTHPGEEPAVLKAHQALLKHFPDLCLILAPRHPERGDALADSITGTGLRLTRHSHGDAPGGAVFLADTLGELGTWYALTDLVFLGGSLRPMGGHNPFEVAHSGAAILSGAHVSNFADSFARLEAMGAARLVADADDLAVRAQAWLSDENARRKACTAAKDFAAAQTDLLDSIAARLIKALGLHHA